MTQAAPDINTAHSRRWLYGMNLALLILVALMILIMMMIAVERFKTRVQWDISSNAVNSLSGSTKKLLKEITDRKQNFHLVSLFTDPSNEEKSRGDNSQAEKRRQVMDVLNLYAKNSPNIQVDDWGDRARDDIEKEIREKYTGELKPYEQAVQEFDPLAKDLRKFANEEAEKIAASLQSAPTPPKPEELEIAQSLQSQFRSIPAKLDDLQRDIHRRTDSTLPEWTEISRDVREVVDNFDSFLQNFSDENKVKELHFPPALNAYFTEATPRYKKLAQEVHAYMEKLKALQTLKVQDILSGVGRNTIVILGPDSAKVLSRWDVFDTAAPADPGAPAASVFKGEEVISSALLAMARPEKVKVVFVTGSPQRIISDSAQQAYSNMSKILEEANFEVLEWSPPGAPSPDQPSPPDPPAQGKGVVWVVFPPDQQNPQMMMMGGPPPNPKPLIDATQKHMSLGGQVLFFAETSGGANPLMGGGSDTYAYDELLKPFGIEVKPKFNAVQLTDQVNRTTGETKRAFAPYLEISHFVDHEITTPVQSLPTAFFPGKAVTVVDVAKNPPAGAEPKAIVRTPNERDYWGEANPDATEPNFDPQTDIAAPVPLIAVSVKDKGKPEEQRVAVIGTKYFAANAIFEAVEPAMINGQLVAVPKFPGNVELMRNTVLWLAGYENMIAVSSKANAGSRLTISPGGLTMMRFGMAVLAPGVVLLLGIIVWVVRHR